MRNNFFGRRRGRFTSCPGNFNHPVRAPRVQKDGTIVLEIVSYENTDDIIEAQRGSTELTAILARYANGDLSVLNKYQGIYTDCTQAPKTLAEAMQSLINAEMAFGALPVDIKRQFDSDWRKWLSSAGSDDWINAMKPIINPSAPASSVEQPENSGEAAAD